VKKTFSDVDFFKLFKAAAFQYLVLENVALIALLCSLHAAIPLLEEPSFVRTPESIEATQGDTVKFSCKAMGKPIPSLLWFRGDRKLPGVPKHKVEIEEKNLIESVLTVKDVKLNVYDGAYLVKAENEAGVEEYVAQLVGKPHTIASIYCTH
jgi:hypothetical protein